MGLLMVAQARWMTDSMIDVPHLIFGGHLNVYLSVSAPHSNRRNHNPSAQWIASAKSMSLAYISMSQISSEPATVGQI